MNSNIIEKIMWLFIVLALVTLIQSCTPEPVYVCEVGLFTTFDNLTDLQSWERTAYHDGNILRIHGGEPLLEHHVAGTFQSNGNITSVKIKLQKNNLSKSWYFTKDNYTTYPTPASWSYYQIHLINYTIDWRCI